MNTQHELAPEQLRRTIDVQSLGIDNTEQLAPLDGIIGQQRAVAALRFGLGISDAGFNIYVAGPPRSGKMTAVQAFIEMLAHTRPTPPDWCYVQNFGDTYQPMMLQLPPGRGRVLQQDMKALVERIRRELPRTFEGDEYGGQRDSILKTLHQQRNELFGRFNERALQEGFMIQPLPSGVAFIPLKDGHPLNDAGFEAMPTEARGALLKQRDQLQEEMRDVMKQGRVLDRSAHEQLQSLDKQIALTVVGGLIDDVSEHYQDLQVVQEYLRAVQEDLLNTIDAFKLGPTEQSLEGGMATAWVKELVFRKYQVNVLVDNSKQAGAPVIVELNPSYPNLVGRIEKESQFGTLNTDFTLIKAGSLHRANGGYLVLPAEDLLRNMMSWEGLKRALHSHEIAIEDLGERLGFLTVKSLRPQPMPLDVKVVLVGSFLPYKILQTYDEMFPELFKVRADFDSRMAWSTENVQASLDLIAAFCHKEHLRQLDAPGAARLLEHSLRLTDDQNKLSTLFGVLTDLVREANFWAEQEGAALIGAAHIRKALDAKNERSSLLQERIRELIANGTLLIDSAGQRIGQINGLAVISLSDYTFGKPSRITASVGPGNGGVIDIEREVKLGGPLHSKGVLILSGYLTRTYAQDTPLSLAARLVFEQSYEGVEGDSASAAELYALLSALAQVPIKQAIAVTGSVNQHGDLQAIGGVNEKIEGYFDNCQVQGLNGEHGVLIPSSNVQHLMLRDDLVAAVEAGTFHIWAVQTVDEGLEILTGQPAGARDFEGQFPQSTVNGRVERRLHEFAERLRERSHPESEAQVLA
jgi:predicted ATP-dependent protease